MHLQRLSGYHRWDQSKYLTTEVSYNVCNAQQRKSAKSAGQAFYDVAVLQQLATTPGAQNMPESLRPRASAFSPHQVRRRRSHMKNVLVEPACVAVADCWQSASRLSISWQVSPRLGTSVCFCYLPPPEKTALCRVLQSMNDTNSQFDHHCCNVHLARRGSMRTTDASAQKRSLPQASPASQRRPARSDVWLADFSSMALKQMPVPSLPRCTAAAFADRPAVGFDFGGPISESAAALLPRDCALSVLPHISLEACVLQCLWSFIFYAATCGTGRRWRRQHTPRGQRCGSSRGAAGEVHRLAAAPGCADCQGRPGKPRSKRIPHRNSVLASPLSSCTTTSPPQSRAAGP